MASGIANHPFLYTPRWTEIPGLNAASQYLLDERDRELEDYLGSLTSGGLGGGIRLSHAASQTVTGLSDSCAPANTETVDYNTTNGGATTGTYVGKTVIQILTAGIWHATGYAQMSGNPTDGSGYANLGCSGDAGGGVISNPVNGTLGLGVYVDLSMDFQVEAGEYIFLAACIAGGEVGGSITVVQAKLAAHLVG